MVMKLLELFSGTGSVGRVAKEMGIEVTSFDRDMTPDIRTDIMDKADRTFQPFNFGIIWASPPCTEYNRAKTVGERKITEANQVVERNWRSSLTFCRFIGPWTTPKPDC